MAINEAFGIAAKVLGIPMCLPCYLPGSARQSMFACRVRQASKSSFRQTLKRRKTTPVSNDSNCVTHVAKLLRHQHAGGAGAQDEYRINRYQAGQR
jgi:hypothetical protein